MKTIYKYEVHPGEFSLNLPEGAIFLHCAEQGNTSQAWFEVDDLSYAGTTRYFESVATGGRVPEGSEYLGTFTRHGGEFVWHLYDLK